MDEPTESDAKDLSPTDPALAAGRNDLRMGRATGQLFWTVETTSGSVRGIANGVIKQFKGVPYGASTAGANRYRPPARPEPWRGIRDCYGYGQVSPQVPMDLTFEYAMLINWDSHVGPGGLGEDCLNLNIWTPGIEDGGRRPVLVAIHGGGWTTGSGNAPMYDGARLAMYGDVVVVSVNHRLGSLGYLALAELSDEPDLTHAGVCGLMDLVAALEWVRDNIERFGGDPGRVTIFGQSGGGSKVLTLMGAPSARGLFHRAVAQSPPAVGAWLPDEGARQAEKLLAALGLDGKRAGDILRTPWEEILAAQATLGDFRPVVDGSVLPRAPFETDAPEASRDVPLILSTTLHDHALRFDNYDLKDADLPAIFAREWGARGAEILAAYRAEGRLESPFLLQGRAWTDIYRAASLRTAALRAEQGGAATYHYIWDWAPDAYDGRWGAFHAVDLDASFHLYRSPACGSGHAEGRLMCDRLASTLVAFGATGAPGNGLIPAWPGYDLQRRATLIFDSEMRVVDDYRGDLVRMVCETVPAAA
jgi:para-nitrobenzyl esterase